ncbi:sigma-70 family RNA polymerase sigma factor [Kerstersia similis]|uniref:sigma-70 family RNA polymerase sigma factor n=1 Tax=Kerstersia similis TaxID=206505 RepID=UPI0039EE219D
MSNPGLDPSDSIARLYRDHHHWLQGWLSRRLSSTADAADLAQDTFLRVLRHGGDTHALQEPRAYLATIAQRLVANLYRRRSLEDAYLSALASLPEASVPSAEASAILLDSLKRLDNMLASLPPRVRTVFLMSQLEGLPHEEIARRLGISLRTVQRHVLRGLEECILLAE